MYRLKTVGSASKCGYSAHPIKSPALRMSCAWHKPPSLPFSWHFEIFTPTRLLGTINLMYPSKIPEWLCHNLSMTRGPPSPQWWPGSREQTAATANTSPCSWKHMIIRCSHNCDGVESWLGWWLDNLKTRSGNPIL